MPVTPNPAEAEPKRPATHKASAIATRTSPRAAMAPPMTRMTR
jgi:hypothetical protein